MILQSKKITIVGFGSQGKSWALNLKDSGFDVKIALRPGSNSMGIAREHGLEVINLKTAFIHSEVLCMLTPDETHAEIFNKYSHELEDGVSIVFAHGFNVHYKQIKLPPSVDVILVSPKGTGKALRELFLKDSGVPSMIAVDNDFSKNSWQIANEIAHALGSHRVEIIKSTFEEETEINLFSEQALYLSVFPEVIKETYNILVDSGYSPSASYYETLHKVGIMAELLQKHGVHEYFDKVSSVARLGGILSKGRIISEISIKEMKKILKEIQDGTFLKRLTAEIASKNEASKEYLSKIKESDLEKRGKLIRDRVFRNV